MNIEQFLDYTKQNNRIMKNVTTWKVIPPKPAVHDDFPKNADDRLIEALKKKGINRLYSHQAKAWKNIQDGKNVVIVTPTASGKTLCYNLPVLDRILQDPEARAIYLFPTKALSQDQVTELQQIVDILDEDIKTFTYDGDTPTNARKAIRKAGHIVVTNPDMLHTAILPHHTKWIKLFENLKYVVVDEIHHYRGVFGSHVANVIRRLSRICKFYGSDPQFICCSATIRNPDELAGRITGRKVDLVDNNGAPSGEKHFIFYNPPVVNWQLGIRKSSLLETKKIASALIKNGIQTIVFSRTRLSVEVLTTYLREAVKSTIGKKTDRIRGYRGGYLPKQRREIEKGLREGNVLAVVSTNALELGIDIGRLESCVICGYPGTISSTWQQAGRAGRRTGTSAIFLVATSSALDQFIINHPWYFFGENIEAGLINPDNLYILVNHIKCAAFEIPFDEGEEFGDVRIDEILEFLEDEEILHKSGNRWYWSTDKYPAEDVSLRSAAAENFVIIDITEQPRVIGEVDRFSAPMLLHEEAIYLHETKQYQVEKLDYDEKKAYVRSVDVDYYTDANLEVDVSVMNVDRETRVDAATTKYVGEVQVNAMVTLFKKIKFHTHENVGSGPVNLPEQEMHTSSYWLGLSNELMETLTPSDVQSGLQGIANLLANISPVYLMCDPRDIHSVIQVRSPFTEKPTVFLYDSYPGGIGLSGRIFEMHDDLLKTAKDVVSRCKCKSGCPSCVGPVDEVGLRGKEITLHLLRKIMG
ncbi:MAG: DEAD/DEAH box helicase [Candidatus Eremiobacteraeota bacterium]|nr:DEAD/DEAH box helicase [Candidatus Eremiobacteraeota bacterium]